MYDFTTEEITKIIGDMPGEYYYYAQEIFEKIKDIEPEEKMIPSMLFYIGIIVGRMS